LLAGSALLRPATEQGILVFWSVRSVTKPLLELEEKAVQNAASATRGGRRVAL